MSGELLACGQWSGLGAKDGTWRGQKHLAEEEGIAWEEPMTAIDEVAMWWAGGGGGHQDRAAAAAADGRQQQGGQCLSMGLVFVVLS